MVFGISILNNMTLGLVVLAFARDEGCHASYMSRVKRI